MPNFISEDAIERAVLNKLKDEFGYELLNCMTTDPDDLNDGSGRSDKREVIFGDRLMEAALRLNPGIPETAIDLALATLTAKRQALLPVTANREIDKLLRDGIPVQFQNTQGRAEQARVRVIDFTTAANNQFLAVSQLWIKGETQFRRPDILLYVNGIPLVFIELKNSNVKLRSAFDDNLTNYRTYIPQLFLTNAFCILSNAIETKVGSITAGWEYFFAWRRVANENEKVDRKQIAQDGSSIEPAISGLCAPVRLLDYIENFIIFHNESEKIIAQNHQFLGVNNAYEAFGRRSENLGKLGVFWHTQGSGKSYSMIFLVRKIFRKLTGNFTFVVITDREDLDGQIYRNFLNTGTVNESEAAQPKNSEEMRRYLGQNKRLVFTLVQKFRYDKGKTYPLLSPRSDIVVIVDEAHRTQYESLAENLRTGLPNAQYLAFTGTPLLGRDRKTNAWFGDYVSEYNFQQSMDDGATVPLYYQKRVPEVQNQNENLSEEFYEILEDENLTPAQQAKLEDRSSQEIEVIKRDSRLELVATDIVNHFPLRGYLGKGMVISVDKFTAVKMCDKVQRLWKDELRRLQGVIGRTANDIEKARLRKRVEYMRSVEMAVVVSEEAGEEEKFAAQNLDIKRHRKRMNQLDEHGHDIEYNFKDPKHKLQLVFVCAMWLTGFDAPTVSTLYMDKPSKGHTLMQTIARTNRVTSYRINGVSKRSGEIVDYYNVFRNMKKALKEYAQGQEGLTDPPVRDKEELFVLLDEAVTHGISYCLDKEINLIDLLEKEELFKKIDLFKEYADILLSKDEWRKEFTIYENTITSLYQDCKPEVMGRSVVRTVAIFQYLRGIMDSIIQQQDIDEVCRRVSELLDESVAVDGAEQFISRDHQPEFRIAKKGKIWDLSKINFDKLREEFQQTPYRNIEIADLRAFIQRKLELMMQENRTRANFAQRFQKIIDTYNSGGSSNESYFEELVKFTQEMQTEDERHIREGLTEDELELFDLLKKDKMTQAETEKVKLAAKSLLHRLCDELPKVLVRDWHQDTQTKLQVRSAVEEVLNKTLPDNYDKALFREKCDKVFNVMLDYAGSGRKWAA